jgi:hypothetical protein
MCGTFNFMTFLLKIKYDGQKNTFKQLHFIHPTAFTILSIGNGLSEKEHELG